MNFGSDRFSTPDTLSCTAVTSSLVVEFNGIKVD